jgi:uncharacterized protein YjbJ (UPF0337 family)
MAPGTSGNTPWDAREISPTFHHDNTRHHAPRKIKNMKSSTHDKAEGTAKNIAGTIKNLTGKALGNPRLESAGKAQQVEGRVQKKIGEIEKVLGD